MPTHSLYLTNSKTIYASVAPINTAEINGENVIVSSVPTAPVFLTELIGDNTILLSFTTSQEEASIIENYQYSLDGGISYITMEYNQSPYTITDLSYGVNYSIKMKAVNAMGEGTESTYSTNYTPTTTASAPTITSITTSSGTAYVYFDAPTFDGGTPITNYAISTGGMMFFYSIIPQTTSPLTITGLSNENSYEIIIKAMNNKGFGLPSNSMSVTLMPTYYYLINSYATSVWLDTTTPESNFVLNDSNVTSWLDKTNNGFNLTNVGTIPYNSISPTSVSLLIGSSFKQTIEPYFNVITSQQTCFFVFSFPNTIGSNDNLVLLGLSNASSSGGFNYLVSLNKFKISYHGKVDGIDFSMTTNTNTKYLISVSLNVSSTYENTITNSILRLNGTTQSVNISNQTNPTSTTFLITGNSPLYVGSGVFNSPYSSTKQFNIHEMIGISNQALNLDNMKTIENYLNTKWNLGYTIT